MARKKSPRYPSMDLQESLEKAVSLYKENHLHAIPNDAAAQSMGYSNANNGSALSAMASLRYFGLVERAGPGMLAASKDVEIFEYAPSKEAKKALLRKWLLTPPVFQKLFDKYGAHLPSDAAIKYDLIQMEFLPAAAQSCLTSFKNSLTFASPESEEQTAVTTENPAPSSTQDTDTENDIDEVTDTSDKAASPVREILARRLLSQTTSSEPEQSGSESKQLSNDRIPVRLRHGRKAWLEIPTPFFEEDKQQLINQINLIMTDEH